LGNLRERDNSEGLGVDWRIILKWILIRVITSQKKIGSSCSTYGIAEVHAGVGGRPEGKRTLVIPKRR
jgi:hypothetical protein